MKQVFFDNLYDVIFHPLTAMERIGAGRFTGQALLVVLFSVLVPVCALVLGIKTTIMAPVVNIIVVIQIMGSIVAWVCGAALWHFIAEFFGGRGTAVGLFAALGFAHIARVFIVPLWVIAALMPIGVKTLLMGIAGLGILCWTVTLDITAIRGVHGLSMGQAVLVLITPLAALILAGVIVIAFVGVEFTHMPMWL